MAKKLYVGNLSYSTNDESLKEFFSQFGTVSSATVITDRMSGRSKGFGFVEYENDSEAQAAIDQSSGKELDGRTIVVNEARPMVKRTGGFGGGNGGPRRSGGFGRRRDFGGDRDSSY